MSAQVSLFVNCFERDYRDVLSPGFMSAKAAQFRFPFARVVVTLNNIADPTCAVALASDAVRRREIDSYIQVAEALPEALATCGLGFSDLGVVRHYMDFALVAVTRAVPGYLLYCCAEVDLLTPFDWISDAVAKLAGNRDILVVNPSWASDPEGASRESVRREGDHWVGSGFSDQCFLVDAKRMAAPIYKYTHEAGARYPMSDLGDIFEKRVDAYMRQHNLLRASDARVFYRHAGTEGQGYPRLPLVRRVLRKARRMLGIGSLKPWDSGKPPCLRGLAVDGSMRGGV